MNEVFKKVTDQELQDAIRDTIELKLNDWERIADINAVYFPEDAERVYVSVITITDHHIAFKTSYIFYVNNYKLEYMSNDGVI